MTCRRANGHAEVSPTCRQHPLVRRNKKRESSTHALDDLGLLDKERADDAVADAGRAARATVRTLDRLDPLRDLRVLARAESRDLCARAR